jgi:4-hydroxy-3-methylbut-2-enyl diphosphate reductase
MNRKKIILAVPHGFCAGVERAIATAETVLRIRRPPVYCLREIVHNRQIIEDLARRGVAFVPNVSDIPAGSTVIFSAHGVAPAVRAAAAARGLDVIDATCPFVNRIHVDVRRFARQGYTTLLIGHRRHEEIVGVAGEAPEHVLVIENEEEARTVPVADASRVAVMTQTTLSVAETERIEGILRTRFPAIQRPSRSSICYATTNRQQAVRDLARRVDVIVVLGAENSSNSNRLVEVARSEGRPAYLASSTDRLASIPLHEATPEYLVREALDRLKRLGCEEFAELVTARENVHLPLPRELGGEEAYRDYPRFSSG